MCGRVRYTGIQNARRCGICVICTPGPYGIWVGKHAPTVSNRFKSKDIKKRKKAAFVIISGWIWFVMSGDGRILTHTFMKAHPVIFSVIAAAPLLFGGVNIAAHEAGSTIVTMPVTGTNPEQDFSAEIWGVPTIFDGHPDLSEVGNGNLVLFHGVRVG